jgi:hypothetical protein
MTCCVEGGEVGPWIFVISVGRIQAPVNVGRALKKQHAPAEPATPALPGRFWNLSFATPRDDPTRLTAEVTGIVTSD